MLLGTIPKSAACRIESEVQKMGAPGISPEVPFHTFSVHLFFMLSGDLSWRTGFGRVVISALQRQGLLSNENVIASLLQRVLQSVVRGCMIPIAWISESILPSENNNIDVPSSTSLSVILLDHKKSRGG